jgi:thiamine biosynthesis lipoprotein
MMADEKSPVRISHRRFATSCLEVRIIMRRIVNERNTKRKKAAIILKRTAAAAMCVILAAGMTACGKKTDSVLSESVSENDKYSSDIFAMDTYMSLTAYGEKAEDAVTEAIHEIQRLDAMFSVGNTDSDVTTANMQGSATVSDETAYLVEQSLEISRKTDGAFDITIYPVMELWGFTTKNYKVPQADELQETLKRVSYENVSLKDHELVLKNNAQIDFGGIAKGYTSSRVMQIFKEYGIEHGMVNLGGNVQTLGTKTDGTAWRVAIQSPQGGNQYLGVLETSDQAVITSGGYERYFEENGVTYHHIIDPKTGYPSDSDLTSVTIVCADGTKADALSTSFFVMGLQKAESFYENTDLDFDVILLTKDNQIYISEGIAQNFTSDYTVNVLKK